MVPKTLAHISNSKIISCKNKTFGETPVRDQTAKKFILCVHGVVFNSCFSLWPGPAQGQVSASSRETVGASSWVTGQSLFSINKPLIWLCFSVRLHPNIAALVPIDPSLYYWRPAPEGRDISPWLDNNPISWASLPAQIVPLRQFCDFCRDHLRSWVSVRLPADVSGTEVCKHLYILVHLVYDLQFRSVLLWALLYSQKGGVIRDESQMFHVYPVSLIS